MRRWMGALALLAGVGAAGAAAARVNPLRVMEERLTTPQVMIVLDTSGSMDWPPKKNITYGGDCGGNDPDLDVCGDAMCTGAEHNGNCPKDCTSPWATDSYAGSVPKCRPGYTKYGMGRLFIVKRVLRNVLPGLRTVGSFGLTIFNQQGHFAYYRAAIGSGCRREKRAVFWSAIELAKNFGIDIETGAPPTSKTWHGTTYTLISAAGLSGGDSLYYRRAGKSGVRKRMNYCGRTCYSGGYNWSYLGSYYAYERRFYLPYVQGPGPCYWNGGFEVTSFDTYRGPQFVDSSGTVWVYHEYSYPHGYHWLTPVWMSKIEGELLVNFSSNPTQAAMDDALTRIMVRLNDADNGGVIAEGYTPLADALRIARKNFADLAEGKGAFAGKPDPAAACRPRAVLLFSDGYPTDGAEGSISEAKKLYEMDPKNPIRTYVIGFAGAHMSTMDKIAKAGGTGAALYADNEADLEAAIRWVLLEAVRADYTTASPAVGEIVGGSAIGNLALIPSAELPDWKGHVRAWDISGTTPLLIWDAGAKLKARDYKSRLIYTGGKGTPVRVLDAAGNVDVAAVQAVWPGTPPSPDEITGFILDIAGKGKEWKLGPILRSTPALIGPPDPLPGAPGHDAFELKYSDRERLVYVASNQGLVHAFSAKDGTEAFAYLPPVLLPRLYALYKLGGQSPLPTEHKWFLGSSPRVGDVRLCTASGVCSWRTHLVQTMGPGGSDYFTLDITYPSYCQGSICKLKDPPFTIVASSHLMPPASPLTRGETWSLPAIFFDARGGKPYQAYAAAGSGYGSPASAGSYYNAFDDLGTWEVSAYAQHVPLAPVVDFAVLANTAAAVRFDADTSVIATYQADLHGRIVRYGSGKPSEAKTIVDAGPNHPFYFTPAVLQRGGKKVTISAVSGSYDEVAAYMNGAGSTFEPKLFLRTEENGTVDPINDNYTCQVSKVCSGSCGTVLDSSKCVAPPPAARPIASPFLLNNTYSGSALLESLYLFYSAPKTVCDSGDSWLVWLRSRGKTQEVVEGKKFPGVKISGLALSGGGTNIVFAQTKRGVKAATPEKLNPVAAPTAVGTGKVLNEGWREVR